MAAVPYRTVLPQQQSYAPVTTVSLLNANTSQLPPTYAQVANANTMQYQQNVHPQQQLQQQQLSTQQPLVPSNQPLHQQQHHQQLNNNMPRAAFSRFQDQDHVGIGRTNVQNPLKFVTMQQQQQQQQRQQQQPPSPFVFSQYQGAAQTTTVAGSNLPVTPHLASVSSSTTRAARTAPPTSAAQLYGHKSEPGTAQEADVLGVQHKPQSSSVTKQVSGPSAMTHFDLDLDVPPPLPPFTSASENPDRPATNWTQLATTSEHMTTLDSTKTTAEQVVGWRQPSAAASQTENIQQYSTDNWAKVSSAVRERVMGKVHQNQLQAIMQIVSVSVQNNNGCT